MLPLVGCDAQSGWAETDRRAETSPLGGPRPSSAYGPLSACQLCGADVMLTSAAYFLKIPFLFCLKFPENVFNL
jgi:hypothetical protein